MDIRAKRFETIDKTDFENLFFDYVDSMLSRRLRWGAIPAKGLEYHVPKLRFQIVSCVVGPPLTYRDVFDIWGVFREKVEREGYFRWEAFVTSADTAHFLGGAVLGKH